MTVQVLLEKSFFVVCWETDDLEAAADTVVQKTTAAAAANGE
jgi:hypothetical protein